MNETMMDSAVRTQHLILFKPQQIIACLLAAKRVVSTTVSVHWGDPKVPSCGFLLNISSLYSLYEGIQSIALLNTIN